VPVRDRKEILRKTATESHELIEAITQIVREKGLDKQFVFESLKASLIAGARKRYGRVENFDVEIDEKTGEITLLLEKSVVEKVDDPDSQIELEEASKIDPDAEIGGIATVGIGLEDFGRTAILVAKQIMHQRVREAEREIIYTEFSDRIGEIISGTVQQVDSRGVVLNLGRTEAVMPLREQIHTEYYRQGNTVRGLIVDVRRTTKGPQVIMSRTHPDFLRKLFQLEVPEIYEGVVEIKAVAREAGERSKIAVSSKDEKIDPVGACVGVKGSRVQAIVRELTGEKIDVIQWSSDLTVFVNRAVSPAKVTRSVFDEENNRVTIIIPEDQLSLAIGRGGQNARLAAKLTGWRIDIKSEAEYAKELERERKAKIPLDEVDALPPSMRKRLLEAGYETADDVRKADPADLLAIPQVGPKRLEKILQIVEEAFEAQSEQAAADTAETSEGDELPVAEMEAQPEVKSSKTAEKGKKPRKRAKAKK
jgi:N utilization substance protein A